MEFLKSTLSSALSKGPPFPYTFLDKVSLPGEDTSSVFTLYNATKREDGSACSVFSFELTDATRNRFPLAKNALRKLRTLRHPGVVKVLDSVETDTYIYIATERVTPLAWHVKRGAIQAETAKWGLWSIAITVKFVNEEARSIHGNVRLGSVFTSESGEWKLAGFEVLSALADDEALIFRYGGLLPDAGRYAAPEVAKGGWEVLKSQPVHVTDSWGFGILIYEAFNGYFPGADQLAQPKKIPSTMTTAYKRLISANPKSRLSVSHFLEQGRRAGGFFDIPLVHISEFVENMGIKDEAEREEFLDELERTGDQFPEDFFKMKILPELLKSVEFGGGGPKVFSAVLRIGEKLSDEEWETSVSPVVIRLFSLPDRATRVFLLDNLGKMIDRLSKKAINDKIFRDMLTGFSDSAPVVREQTVKAVLVIITKLSDRNINGDLLKHLARTQNDEQPGIRTNTTICLGKIARHLGANTRQKVLVAAFTRSLRDPFVPARNAALLALAATADVFDETDCAGKVIPAISPSLVDKEKSIREQASKTLDLYISRIKTLTANYPETAGPSAADTTAAKAGGVTTVQPGGWTSWAVGTLTTAAGQMATKSPTPAPPPEERPTSAPIPSPVRPVPKSVISSPPVTKPFKTEEADPWGDFTEEPEPEPEPQETFLSGLEKKVGRPVPTTTKENKKGFGPPNVDEIDFEALLAGRDKRKVLSKGLAKKPATKKPIVGGSKRTTTTTTAKKVEEVKPEAKKEEKNEEKKEEEKWNDADDWGDAWN